MKFIIILMALIFAPSSFAGGTIVVGVVSEMKDAIPLDFLGKYGDIDVLSAESTHFSRLRNLKNLNLEIRNGDNIKYGTISEENADTFVIRTEDAEDVVIFNGSLE